MTRPFRERNPVPIGIAGLAVLGVLGYTAFNAQNLTILGGGGDTYSAAFSEAGDLKKLDEVRVAGVSVGKVTEVDLQAGHVQVTFRLKPGTWIGDASRAAIKLRTIVGARYLEVVPDGSHTLPAHGEIPLEHTAAPFSITATLNNLSSNLDQIDIGQLAQSFKTISQTFQDTPQVSRQALVGLSRLSDTITKRDGQIRSLLDHTRSVAGTVADRDEQLTRILSDSDLVLKVLNERRAVITAVLVHTDQLASEITGLVRENRATLAPALARLRSVITVLENNRANIDRTVQELAPFVRNFANTVGNGRWFDTFITNLPPNANPLGAISSLVQSEIAKRNAAGAGR
jgi:phospholipid/cholesterol/gamma-HCH transport system substrate-binding protein